MHVVYIQDAQEFTGIGRYADDLYKLMKNDSEIIQFVFDKRFINHNQFVKKIYGYNNISILNRIFPKFIFKAQIEMLRLKNSIVHLTSTTFPSTLLFNKNKTVITIHDLIPFKKIADYNYLLDLYYRHNLKRYIKYYVNILTVSNYVKNELISNFKLKEENVTVIPPVISDYFYHVPDKAELRKKLNLPLDRKLILSVSSLERRKNPAMIQTATNKLSRDFQLVRIGPAVRNSINFNRINMETINEIYNACDMLYFPTLEEGFGSPLVEAMRVGIPIVSSNIPVVKEVVGDAGKLVDPNDVDENIEAIYHVAENPNYYILKGYERSKLYSGETVKEKLYKYYSTISCN